MFRNTGMTDDEHVAFSYRLGDLDTTKRFVPAGANIKRRYEPWELFDAGNLDADNNVLPVDSARSMQNKGNELFHTDSSFNARRASYSLLRAVAIPPPGHGGNTEFADSRAAWDQLDEAARADLRDHDYVGAFSYMHSRKNGAPDFFRDLDPTGGPMALHRIAQVHEASGRMNLYVGAHLHHLEGVDPDKSSELIARLNRHVTQPRNVVSIGWDQPGDMIIWDNTCVLHRAAGGTFGGKFKRDLRRATVHDASSTAWGLNEAGKDLPGLSGMPSASQPQRPVETKA